MEKQITVKEFAKELKVRIDSSKDIECCREEIKRLAELAAVKIPDEKLMVMWKDR